MGMNPSGRVFCRARIVNKQKIIAKQKQRRKYSVRKRLHGHARPTAVVRVSQLLAYRLPVDRRFDRPDPGFGQYAREGRAGAGQVRRQLRRGQDRRADRSPSARWKRASRWCDSTADVTNTTVEWPHWPMRRGKPDWNFSRLELMAGRARRRAAGGMSQFDTGSNPNRGDRINTWRIHRPSCQDQTLCGRGQRRSPLQLRGHGRHRRRQRPRRLGLRQSQ